jgi:hypothetical protein
MADPNKKIPVTLELASWLYAGRRHAHTLGAIEPQVG